MPPLHEDDEISTVLRHFRPKPAFECASKEIFIQQRQRRKRGRCDRGYSSFRFISDDDDDHKNDMLHLTYLHVHNSSTSIFLTFEIPIDTRSVTCVQCCVSPDVSSATSLTLKSQLDKICLSVSDKHASLFSIASRLLQTLNDDFSASIDKIFDCVVFGPSSRRLQIALHALLDDRPRPHDSGLVYRLLDIQTLLIRCAAVGLNGSKICAPVPLEFTSASDGDELKLAQLVFVASDRLYAPLDETVDDDDVDDAYNLLAFLRSLPWMECRSLKCITKSKTNCDLYSNQSNGDRIVARLHLEIGNALGDPSPIFSKLATKYGLISVYHGTKIERVWSILNHGLRNLSYDGALTQNGAIFGDGVYMTSSIDVARYFAESAAQRPPKSLSFAFNHDSLLDLLSLCDVDVSSLDQLVQYNITCLPVFGATIIKPPPQMSTGSDRICSTRQDGKYYVVSDSEMIRITDLYLTIELTRKSSIWRYFSPVPFYVVFPLIVAIIWAIFT